MRNPCSVTNRSPWLVEVRSQRNLTRQFSYPCREKAEAYLDELSADGLKARLTQLENAFQLRVRRVGLKQQTVTFDTQIQAEQGALKIASDLSVGIIRDYAVATRTTLRQLMSRYLDEVVPAHKGASAESARLQRLMRNEAFVDKKLAALSTADLQEFIRDRLTEVAPATVDRDLDLIAQVLNYARDIWKIAAYESPMVGLRRPKYFNERERRLSPGEEERLLSAARADSNPFVEPAIILALETAARRGELLSLTPADINIELRYALLKETKNGRSRKVPLSGVAIAVIRKLIEDCDSPEQPLLDITPNALKIAFFRRVIPASGLEDFHFHDLRHESISRLAESGKFSLLELQAISGHRDTRMLQRYAHLCASKLAEKMDMVVESVSRVYFHRGRRRKVETVTQLVEMQPARRAPECRSGGSKNPKSGEARSHEREAV